MLETNMDSFAPEIVIISIVLLNAKKVYFHDCGPYKVDGALNGKSKDLLK